MHIWVHFKSWNFMHFMLKLVFFFNSTFHYGTPTEAFDTLFIPLAQMTTEVWGLKP